MTSAILYAAKSTEDRCGSIPTRLADWRAAAEEEGRDVVAHCSDESASAHKGNRGPGLERAMAHPERAGAELRVRHSDRLARGDGAGRRKRRHDLAHRPVAGGRPTRAEPWRWSSRRAVRDKAVLIFDDVFMCGLTAPRHRVQAHGGRR